MYKGKVIPLIEMSIEAIQEALHRMLTTDNSTPHRNGIYRNQLHHPINLLLQRIPPSHIANLRRGNKKKSTRVKSNKKSLKELRAILRTLISVRER